MTTKKPTKGCEESPALRKGLLSKQKTLMHQIMYMRNITQAQRERSQDSFKKTVAFSNGMGEAYSDVDHFNQ